MERTEEKVNSNLAALGILVVSLDYGTNKSRAEVTLKGNCNSMKTELRR